MADEIINHTGPSPPTFRSYRYSRNLQFHAYVSTRRFDFKRATRFLCLNPNICYIYQQMAPWVPRQSSRQINGPSQNINGFQPRIYGNHEVIIYQPVTQSNATHLFPHGTTLMKIRPQGSMSLLLSTLFLLIFAIIL